MNLTKFSGASPGVLVKIDGHDARHREDYEHKAFVPHPLPDSFEPDQETWSYINHSREALGRLDEALHFLPNPDLLRRLVVRREAQSTSALEGTWATLNEVLEAEASPPSAMSAEVREILNFVEVTELALEHIRNQPMNVPVLCELQKRLVRGTSSDDEQAGQVRTRQVLIGPKNVRVAEARFVPPPHEFLETGLNDWIAWLQIPGDPITKVALAHYQFETLHPFTDGNGRLGRLMIVLELVRTQLLADVMLPVSPWLERRRDDYQQGLLELSQNGDFDVWIRLIAECIDSQARAVVQQIHALHDFRARAHESVVSHGIRGVGERLADDLIGWPVVKTTEVRDRYGVTYMGAKHAIQRLVDAGLLRELATRSGKLFVNQDVIQIVEDMTS